MSYRPPGKAPLTNWGRFLVRRRRELDLSATQAFEAVREGLGLGVKSRSAYLPFEYDRVPDEREAAALRAVFGDGPTDADEVALPLATASDRAELVSAIRDLVDELRLARQEQMAWNAGVQEVVRVLAERLAPSPPIGDPVPGHPGGVPR